MFLNTFVDILAKCGTGAALLRPVPSDDPARAPRRRRDPSPRTIRLAPRGVAATSALERSGSRPMASPRPVPPRRTRNLALRLVASRAAGIPLAPKAKKIAKSNWSRDLTHEQLTYSARDAWLGAVVFEGLKTETGFLAAATAAINAEIPIAELSELASKRRTLKVQMRQLDRDVPAESEQYAALRRQLATLPRPDPRMEINLHAFSESDEV